MRQFWLSSAFITKSANRSRLVQLSRQGIGYRYIHHQNRRVTHPFTSMASGGKESEVPANNYLDSITTLTPGARELLVDYAGLKEEELLPHVHQMVRTFQPTILVSC